MKTGYDEVDHTDDDDLLLPDNVIQNIRELLPDVADRYKKRAPLPTAYQLHKKDLKAFKVNRKTQTQNACA